MISLPTSSPRLPTLLDMLEAAQGPYDAIPSADGWHLVIAENIGYLVDDQRRWQAVAELESLTGLAPERILATPDAVLRGIVVGPGPDVRVARLRRCAELAIADAPWRAYPGIGRPGAERIELFTGTRSACPDPCASAGAPSRPRGLYPQGPGVRQLRHRRTLPGRRSPPTAVLGDSDTGEAVTAG